MPPKDSQDYDFQPRSLEPPPMPPEVFIHYLGHGEGDLNPLRNDWLGHLPKRLKKHDAACEGYGMHIIEGPHKFCIFVLTVIVIICSVLTSIAYSTKTGDVQDGTGIGAFVIGCYKSFLWAWTYWRSGS